MEDTASSTTGSQQHGFITHTLDTPHGGHSQLDDRLLTPWVYNTCKTYCMEDTASSTKGSQHHGFTTHVLQTHHMEDTASSMTGSQHHGFTTHALQTHRMEDTASSRRQALNTMDSQHMADISTYITCSSHLRRTSWRNEM